MYFMSEPRKSPQDLVREIDRLLLQEGTHAFPVNNPIPDEIIVNEGPSGRWMSMPISHEEVDIMRRLPKSAKEDFKKNVHEYIGQMGKEYKALTAMPLDEAPYAG